MADKHRVIFLALGIGIGLILLCLSVAIAIRLTARKSVPSPIPPLPTVPMLTDAAILAPTQDDLPQYHLESGHDLVGPGNVPDTPRVAGYECLWSTDDPDTVAYGAFNVTTRIELFQDEIASGTAYRKRVTELKEAVTGEDTTGLQVAQEIAAPTVGRAAVAYQLKGTVQDANGQPQQVIAYTVIFTQRNAVVTVTTLGYKDYRLLDDATRLAQSIARRMY
ncbi:MAG: hypothetical protein NUW24_08565 [Anaerolineae bacterium]|jgi:hypothetical protein|nr:hypothetical protein [Anaerolineae bacterium]MDH7474172.1 hypothetical protein [Anaerolineae bacterium]